jgi:histidine ammonia-lyase/tyrosine ammonia-lyase
MKLDGESLTISDIYNISYKGEPVELSEEQMARVKVANERVQQWGREQHPIYGVNTGFGEMISVIIPPELGSQLQYNLLRSHAGGGGEPFSDEIVRAIMAVRANCLIKGYSGISPAAIELLKEMINRGIHPIVPQQGSLGASGDLGPLAQMALPLIGDGYVRHKGQKRKSREVFDEHGLTPIVPGFKEALALINGTSPMTAVAALALVDGYHLMRLALFASAYAVQCLNASTRPFEHKGNALKNHEGQVTVARIMRELVEGSQLMREHINIMGTMREKVTQTRAELQDEQAVVDTRTYLQNAYSLRAMPQILGVPLETMRFCQRLVEEEANSCNDNPLIFESAETCFHGANFHGQYVAAASDYFNIAIAEVGVLAERQLNRLVDPHLNNKLPAFLAYQKTGLYMGFQGLQYLATSIASENLDLAAPASIKSIPSNGQNQDVVSMGLNSARKSLQLVENVATIFSVMIGACRQASHLVGQDKFSAPIREFQEMLPVMKEVYKDEGPGSEIISEIRAFIVGKEMRSFLESRISLDKQ